MSSDYKVPYTTILEINQHPNADRLSLATVYGFQIVVQKDKYKVGDKIVLVPIDSVLPDNLEKKLFPEGSKIKLHSSRVRQIKIRSFPSQGMIVDPSELTDIISLDKIPLETDLSKFLNINKYEPPAPKGNNLSIPKTGRKSLANPDFHSYNGLLSIKWNPNMFKEGDMVIIQEKLHGTNARAAVLSFRANTFFKKIKRLLGLSPKSESLYGSNRVDISNAAGSYKGFYGTDVYGSVFNKLDVFKKIKLGETIFGEIVGPGIQKGYSYSLKEHTFVLFDVKVLQPDGTQKWLNPSEVKKFAIERGFQFVPVVYEGPFNKELAYTLSRGPSVFDPKEKVREGIVIKAAENYSVEGNKQALKWVSEDYLSDASNTDEH